jgi:hypothetical protein
MEPEDSLPSSQDPATGLYPESYDPVYTFTTYFSVVSSLQVFRQHFYAFISSPMLATYSDHHIFLDLST